MAERLIAEYCRAYGMRALALRYFNVAGADADGEIGECHEPETHLVPNLVRAALDPASPAADVFGDDFPTRDGTCLRDYVHVEDLCDAHLRALDHLRDHDGFRALNLGTGSGHTVAEVVAAVRRHHGGRPAIRSCDRRPGDPPSLVASHDEATRQLDWRPRRTLDDIVASASAWHAQAR